MPPKLLLLPLPLSLLLLLLVPLPPSTAIPLPHARPPPSQRRFNSSVVNAAIASLSSRMRDPDLATLFSNCLPNTLDTTVSHFCHGCGPGGGPDAFVITGDITAQWLRDSTNQLLPYLPFAPQDPNLAALACGLVRRQARDILHDPFANAFNYAEEGGPHQGDVRTPPMTPHVFEGKFELDSLAAFLRLSNGVYNWTGAACLANSSEWVGAAALVVSTVRGMQRSSEETLDAPAYLFERKAYAATDTTELQGAGPPAAPDTGMARSAFRPSDDATKLPFLVPANAMMSVELGRLGATLRALSQDVLAANATALSAQLRAGIEAHATPNNRTYAYEVDGYGGAFYCDDANIPSLLSLPLLGYLNASDPAYVATRAAVLSPRTNPYFFHGPAGEGVGGPHEGLGYIWPMSVIVRAMTSDSDAEIEEALGTLVNSSAGTGFLHESFYRSDVTKYTRPWFAWVNGLFGELVLQLARERPHLLF